MSKTGSNRINKYGILLAAVIIARATSLLIVKAALADFSIFNLMALRFVIAFICILPFTARRRAGINKSALLHGVILGLLFFVMIALELLGLRMTGSASEVSFLENTSIILVPLTAALISGRLPERRILIAAAAAFTGVGFLLMKGGRMELTAGTLVCVLIAVIYTIYVILTGRLSRQDDPLVLGAVQIGVVGALSGIATFALETPRMPAGNAEWAGIMLLAVICSSIGTALQPVAQSRVSAEKTGIFCALNPLTACALGWTFLGEWSGVSGLAGAALILAAIVITNTNAPAISFAKKRRPSAKKRDETSLISLKC